MRVADKPTPEPILRCFTIRERARCWQHLELSKRAKKKKLKMLEIAGPKSFQY